MGLPERAIQEFRELWKQTYGEDLDFETAKEQAEALLAVTRFAYTPQPYQKQPMNTGPPP